MYFRRHQKNHAQEDAIVCEYPDCGKTFYRMDLLHRHQEFAKQNSNEPGQQSPTPTFSPEVSPEAHEPPEQVPVSLDLSARTLSPSTTSSITYYSSQPVLDLHEPTAFSRYTFTSFLTPQVPRTPRLSSSGLIARSSSISSPK
jgi:uncharacterized Zn-finger protein